MLKGRSLGPKQRAECKAKVEPKTEGRGGVWHETQRPEPSIELDVNQGPGLGQGAWLRREAGAGT